MMYRTAVLALAVAFLASVAQGQRVHRVALSKSSSAKVAGRVKGKAYVDYRMKIGAGQAASVTLTSDSRSVNFNFLPPGSKGVAMFNGSMRANKMDQRIIPVSGDYTVRVYQMGAAAAENKTNGFTITVSVKGTTRKALPRTADATLAGTPYHARSVVHCFIYWEKTQAECNAYIIRYGGGSATVEFRAGSLVRRVLFVNGVPKAHDSQEALTFSKSGDDTTVRFGDGPSEEFVVPDALVFGG